MQKKSYLYIISNGDAYKVGVSKNAKKRLKQLQTGSAQELSLCEEYCLPEELVYRLEKRCHEKINHFYTKRGEWFNDASLWHLRVIIEEICENYLLDFS